MNNIERYNKVCDELQKYKDGINDSNYKQVLSDLYAVKCDWDETRNQQFGYQYNNIIAYVAFALIMSKDFNNAYDILVEGIKKVEEDYPDFGQAAKTTLYYYLGVVQCYLGQDNDAAESFHSMVYWDILNIFHTVYPSIPHYSFRGITNYSLDDLRNNQISLSAASDFNDPSDTPFFLWAEKHNKSISDPIERRIADLITDAYKESRMRCFSTDCSYPTYDNPKPSTYSNEIQPYLDMVMWAHYADYHKGFCAKYVFPSDFNSPKMENGDLCRFVEMDYNDTFIASGNITYKDGFFTKGKRWEYEHEKRMIYYTQKRSDVKGHPEIQLIDGCLEAVYLGIKCSDAHKTEIIDIIKKYSNVKLYQMKVSEKDLFKMETEEIKL